MQVINIVPMPHSSCTKDSPIVVEGIMQAAKLQRPSPVKHLPYKPVVSQPVMPSVGAQSFETVSDTHLDVYKRQVIVCVDAQGGMRKAFPDRPDDGTDFLRHGASVGIAQDQAVRAVLMGGAEDVYKRQPMLLSPGNSSPSPTVTVRQDGSSPATTSDK